MIAIIILRLVVSLVVSLLWWCCDARQWAALCDFQGGASNAHLKGETFLRVRSAPWCWRSEKRWQKLLDLVATRVHLFRCVDEVVINGHVSCFY